MMVNVYTYAVCLDVKHLFVMRSHTGRVVHGGGYPQCKALSVIMGGLDDSLSSL